MLATPRAIFGVHNVTPYNRTDGTFYGILKVVAGSTLNLSGSIQALKGGSSKVPWAVEEGELSAQLQLKVREYPDFLFQLFGGLTPTENGADASGNVSTLTNKLNTSVMNATTGIASVAAISGSEGDLKFGKYVVVAKSPTTVDIYCSSDADFGRGTVGTYATSALDIVAMNQTITASTATNITGFGFKLMGGSGAIALVSGDTATFEIRPKNTANMVGILGSVTSNFPEFGAICMAKKRATGELFEVDCFRCKGEGIPIHFEENKWSEADIKVMLMYDPAQDGFARMRLVTPITPN